MKVSSVLMVLLLGTGQALGQGKVSLCNDLASPILFPADPSQILAADAALAGQCIPACGPLPSGVTLVVGLYAGTSSTSLALAGSVVLNPPGCSGQAAGIIPVTHVILPFAGGAAAWFQVRIWDSRFANYDQAVGGGSYIASTSLFTMIPGTSISYPCIVNGGQTTWVSQPILIGGWGPCPCPLYIYQYPISQTVTEGATANFSIGVGGGSGPISYQWYFKSSAITGANSPVLTITNAGAADDGAYHAVAYTSSSSITSPTVYLNVLLQPRLTSVPLAQTAEAGASVVFEVGAAGAAPLQYLWFFNETNVLGRPATNSPLRLTNVQFASSGAYRAVITNAAGSVTSPPAMLNVIAPVPRLILGVLRLNGAPGEILNVESSFSLAPADWLPLQTIQLTNSSQWYFPPNPMVPPGRTSRFYRVGQTNGVAKPSSPEIFLVPRLAVFGSVGDSYRVDFINQVGPTDAWSPLGTLTLTASPGWFYDVSAVGQSPRLYRLVPVP